MSAVTIEIAEEFLEKMHTKKQKQIVLELACIAWNIASFSSPTVEPPDLEESYKFL